MAGIKYYIWLFLLRAIINENALSYRQCTVIPHQQEVEEGIYNPVKTHTGIKQMFSKYFTVCM